MEAAQSTGATGPDLDAATKALDDFCGADTGRSVACAVLRGPAAFAHTVRAKQARPGASLLKVPLVAAVLAAAEAGRLDLSEEVMLDLLPPTGYPSIIAAFDQNRRLSLREVCRLTLITSDNRAASYLWSLLGAAPTNEMLETMGCIASRAQVSYEDDRLGIEGRANTMTAADALQMFSFIHAQEQSGLLLVALRNNLRNQRIPLFLKDEVPVVHKTGTLEGVANDAGVVYAGPADVAFAFLTDAQPQTELTSIEIGHCVKQVLDSLGLTSATQ